MAMKQGVLLVSLLFTVKAFAQPVWSFEQVLQATLTNHPQVLAKRSAKTAAEADRRGAEWQRYPALSAEASSRGGGPNSLVRLEQPLWTGGRITAGIDAASRRLDAADAAVDEARLEISLRVIASASEALRQKMRQAHGAAGVKEHEKLLAMIQRRVTQEVSPLADQRLASSRLYSTINDLSVTKQALSNALAQLSQLAGQPVTDMSDEGLRDIRSPASLESALNDAIAYSPTLRRLSFEEQVAEAEIALRRSAYQPQIVFRLERAGSGNVGLPPDNRASIVLLAQPGAGLSALSNADAAVAKYEAARLTKETAERDLRERVTVDWNEWSASRLRLENASQARLMTAEVSESYARQYTAGRKTWIDVLNAVREATQSELAVDDAKTQMLAAGLRLRSAMGRLMTPTGSMQ